MEVRPTFGSPPLNSPPSDKQVCLYVAEMCAELRGMTRKPRFRTISYLLDMVRLEAERMAENVPD